MISYKNYDRPEKMFTSVMGQVIMRKKRLKVYAEILSKHDKITFNTFLINCSLISF